MTPSSRALACGLLGVALVVLTAGGAAAHASLVASEPSPAADLPAGQAPVLHFSEPVLLSASTLGVRTASGRLLAVTPVAHLGGDARTLTAAASAVPPAGPVTLRWTVLAEDGHRASGSFALTLPLPVVAVVTPPETAPTPTAPLGPATAAVPATEESPTIPDEPVVRPPSRTGRLDRAFTASRSVGYLAMTVLCGGLAFLALAWPEGAEVSRVRRLLTGAWALGVVTSLSGVGLQAAYAGRLGLGAVVRPSVVIPELDTRAGLAWASRGLLFVLAVPVLAGLRGGADAVRSLGWRVGAAAVAVGLLRTPGLVGHASEGRMAWLGSIADLAHLIGVAVWLGGLVLLCTTVLPRRRPDELRRVVPRFSTMAGAAVAVVVVAGGVLSWQLVGSFGALAGTRFGHVLLVKLALVAAIGGAAFLSHRWSNSHLDLVLASAEPVGPGSLRPFVISVATEVALAVAVLTAASVLVATSPAR